MLKMLENDEIMNDRYIGADCRSFSEKRNEISDAELESYLLKESSRVRRNATFTEMERDT